MFHHNHHFRKFESYLIKSQLYEALLELIIIYIKKKIDDIGFIKSKYA